ncbi:MAG TPA: hypothetical protein VI997_06950 [Candidatus Thermoplasmatota archaeon]|nr:hypothetical protein [Candidatus Thermoplasmatota archaeon]
MRRLALVLVLAFLATVLAPTVAADIVVRTCDSSTSCSETARVPAPGGTCYVDYMKNGLGKPGSIRSTCVTH